MTPTVKDDPDANAADIRLSPGPVEDSEEVADGIVLDFDAAGRLGRLEVEDAGTHLPPDLSTKGA
jgi:uncharacterized protein YuzE